MKNRTRYIVVLIILLFSFLLIYFDSINLFDIIKTFFNSSKEEILSWNTGGVGYNDISEINIFKHLLLVFSQEFSAGITHASSFLSTYSILVYVIPFLALFSSFSLIDRKNTINNFVYVRLDEKHSCFNFNFRSIIKESLSISFLVYGVYFLYALFITVFYGFGLSPIDSSDFLVNTLTLRLFGNYGTLFYIFSSLFSVLLGTFIIVFFVCSVGYVVQEKLKLFLLVVLYYFGGSFLLNVFGLFSPNISVYLSPLTIINPFPYPVYRPLLLIFINLIPLVAGVIILKRDSIKYEIS